MIIPSPDPTRTIALDTGAQMLLTRGISPVVPCRWKPQNPLDRLWSWIDATVWCQDIGDTIGQIGWQIVTTDGALAVLESNIQPNGYIGGLRISGGTPAIPYVVRVRLTALNTGEQRTVDVSVTISAAAPVVALPPTQATINGDGLVYGGIPVYLS